MCQSLATTALKEVYQHKNNIICHNYHIMSLFVCLFTAALAEGLQAVPWPWLSRTEWV